MKEEMKNLTQQFETHEREDERRFQEGGKRFEGIETTLRDIKENHLAHIQTDMARQTTDIAVMKESSKWTNRYLGAITSVIVGTLILYFAKGL